MVWEEESFFLTYILEIFRESNDTYLNTWARLKQIWQKKWFKHFPEQYHLLLWGWRLGRHLTQQRHVSQLSLEVVDSSVFAVCFLLTKVFTWIFWTFCTWELYAFRQFETLTTCWEMAPRWLVFTYIILVFSFETLRSQHISIRAHSALVEGLHSSTMFNSEACSDLTADSKSKVSHLTHLFANQKGNSNKSNVQNMLWMTKVISEPWKFYSPKRILPHTFWQSWSWCIWFVLFN